MSATSAYRNALIFSISCWSNVVHNLALLGSVRVAACRIDKTEDGEARNREDERSHDDLDDGEAALGPHRRASDAVARRGTHRSRGSPPEPPPSTPGRPGRLDEAMHRLRVRDPPPDPRRRRDRDRERRRRRHALRGRGRGSHLHRRRGRARRARLRRRLRHRVAGRALRPRRDGAPPVDAREPARVLRRPLRAPEGRGPRRADLAHRLAAGQRAPRARTDDHRRRPARRGRAHALSPAAPERHDDDADAGGLHHRHPRHRSVERRRGRGARQGHLGDRRRLPARRLRRSGFARTCAPTPAATMRPRARRSACRRPSRCSPRPGSARRSSPTGSSPRSPPPSTRSASPAPSPAS